MVWLSEAWKVVYRVYEFLIGTIKSSRGTWRCVVNVRMIIDHTQSIHTYLIYSTFHRTPSGF